MIVLEEVTTSLVPEKTEEFSRNATSGIDCIVKAASMIDGFDTIVVEKKQTSNDASPLDESTVANNDIALNDQKNRQNVNLRENFDFIKIPKKESSPTREATK